LRNGQIELMQHRRVATDDQKGIGARDTLNEFINNDPNRDAGGIKVKATYIVSLTKLKVEQKDL